MSPWSFQITLWHMFLMMGETINDALRWTVHLDSIMSIKDRRRSWFLKKLHSSLAY